MDTVVLFDLDDTLLQNDMGDFLPAYFGLLQEAFDGVAEPDLLITEMVSATQAMIANQDPLQSLEQVFNQAFYPGLAIEYQDVVQLIRDFYSREYPVLGRLTKPVLGAQDVIREFRAADYRLSVATNPLFPETAIYQRIQWAGYSNPKDEFELITAFEGFHFAKPNPAYFAEILARMGWPEGRILMVGNDPINDIQGAQALGLATYLVTDAGNRHLRAGGRNGAGLISGLVEWLGVVPEDQLVPAYESREAVLAIARSTLAVLEGWVRDQAIDLDWRANENEWSIREILCHVQEVDDKVHVRRINRFDHEESPFIQAVDTHSWFDAQKYAGVSGQEAFQSFSETRLAILEKIVHLDPEDWRRPARHAILGPTDFRETMRIMAIHDQVHIRQIWDIIKNRAPDRI